ncbi:MAG TPA: class I SAM-dependent methyltransferase [Chloroflexota bacterium]|nr:class I SAM-dependent methyltransferase [Chloroflexota bacterium]
MTGDISQGSNAGDFPKRLLDIYTGAVLTCMIAIGHQTGLFEAAAKGPATCDQLAERAHLTERYVREWLGAMVTGGIMVFRPDDATYELPLEQRRFLSGDAASNAAPQSQLFPLLGRILPEVVTAFREGGGVPYERFRPEFTWVMDENWRRIYDSQLIDGFLPLAAELPVSLEAGIRVADFGCGTGHALNVMAREYPTSRFVGYDISDEAIHLATREAVSFGLTNVRFEARDATTLSGTEKFDLITAFDSIHDCPRPAVVLRAIRDALDDDGMFLMVEHDFASDLEGNLDNPFAPMYYGLSTMHCLTVSLAEGGAGLGALWGRQSAIRMLADAGFDKVEVVGSPRPQNAVFICRIGAPES